jgi:hypothetical protein
MTMYLFNHFFDIFHLNKTTRNVIKQEINQNTRVVIDDDDECPRGWVRMGDECEPSCPFYWCGWYPWYPIYEPIEIGECPPGNNRNTTRLYTNR